jgi:hypothetical protein
MAKRPVEFLNGKELAGEFTQPIDHGLYMPFLGAVGSPERAKYLAERKKGASSTANSQVAGAGSSSRD